MHHRALVLSSLGWLFSGCLLPSFTDEVAGGKGGSGGAGGSSVGGQGGGGGVITGGAPTGGAGAGPAGGANPVGGAGGTGGGENPWAAGCGDDCFVALEGHGRITRVLPIAGQESAIVLGRFGGRLDLGAGVELDGGSSDEGQPDVFVAKMERSGTTWTPSWARRVEASGSAVIVNSAHLQSGNLVVFLSMGGPATAGSDAAPAVLDLDTVGLAKPGSTVLEYDTNGTLTRAAIFGDADEDFSANAVDRAIPSDAVPVLAVNTNGPFIRATWSNDPDPAWSAPEMISREMTGAVTPTYLRGAMSFSWDTPGTPAKTRVRRMFPRGSESVVFGEYFTPQSAEFPGLGGNLFANGCSEPVCNGQQIFFGKVNDNGSADLRQLGGEHRDEQLLAVERITNDEFIVFARTLAPVNQPSADTIGGVSFAKSRAYFLAKVKYNETAPRWVRRIDSTLDGGNTDPMLEGSISVVGERIYLGLVENVGGVLRIYDENAPPVWTEADDPQSDPGNQTHLFQFDKDGNFENYLGLGKRQGEPENLVDLGLEMKATETGAFLYGRVRNGRSSEDETAFLDGLPTVDPIDSVSPERPIFLFVPRTDSETFPWNGM